MKLPKLLSMLLIGLSLALIAGAIAGFIPNIWLCDIASQLRIILAITFLFCFVLLVALRSKVGIAITLIGIVINAYPIASMYARDKQLTEQDSKTISILNFNTQHQHNDRYASFEDLVTKYNPDIVTIVEINQKWVDAIEPTMKLYPYRKTIIKGPGMALYSKYPIERTDISYFGRNHHPRVSSAIQVAGQSVQLLIAHPTTPLTPSRFRERNQEMLLIGNEIKTLPSPKILIGDFNCGPWSAAFKNLLACGLNDSEQGFGPQPSWSTHIGRVLKIGPVPPVIPIDHILVSKDINVLSRETGPDIGSDHLPVIVKMTIPK